MYASALPAPAPQRLNTNSSRIVKVIQFKIIIEASSRPPQAGSKPEADREPVWACNSFSGPALLVSLVRAKIRSRIAVISKEVLRSARVLESS